MDEVKISNLFFFFLRAAQTSLTFSFTSARGLCMVVFFGLEGTTPNFLTIIVKHGINNTYKPAKKKGDAISHPSNCKIDNNNDNILVFRHTLIKGVTMNRCEMFQKQNLLVCFINYFFQ